MRIFSKKKIKNQKFWNRKLIQFKTKLTESRLLVIGKICNFALLKRLSIIFFLIQINASRKPCFPPFIEKRVEGIFGYDILLYGFLFRTRWGSSSQSFARIGLFGSRARFHALRCTSSDLHSTNKKKNIFKFRTHFDIFIIQAYTTIWSIIKKTIETK